MQLSCSLAIGDCGSAVFDALSNDFYGHIIAGCRRTGFAYVMASVNVLRQIEKALQADVAIEGDLRHFNELQSLATSENIDDSEYQTTDKAGPVHHTPPEGSLHIDKGKDGPRNCNHQFSRAYGPESASPIISKESEGSLNASVIDWIRTTTTDTTRTNYYCDQGKGGPHAAIWEHFFESANFHDEQQQAGTSTSTSDTKPMKPFVSGLLPTHAILPITEPTPEEKQARKEQLERHVIRLADIERERDERMG